MRSVLRTLAQCHARKVLHRDIKPGNFLLATPDDKAPLKAIGGWGGGWVRGRAGGGASVGACRQCEHEGWPAAWDALPPTFPARTAPNSHPAPPPPPLCAHADFGLAVFYEDGDLPRTDLGLEGTPW